MLLSLDRGADVCVFLEIDQTIEPVLAGEAGEPLILVLVGSALEVIGHADLQSPRAPGHDVDPVAVHDACLTLSGKSLRVDPSPRTDSGQALPPLALRLARDDKTGRSR